MRIFSWLSPVWPCVAGLLLAGPSIFAQTPAADTPAEQASTPVATAPATPTPTASPVAGERVLYPTNGVPTSPVLPHGNIEPTAGMSSLAMSFLMLLALCAAGYYLLRRQTGFAPSGKGQRKLSVSESRSLGNRQFLVVVEYESERLLLGVTPGKIDYLCPLPSGNVTSNPFKEQAP